jgi:hypothetical protein
MTEGPLPKPNSANLHPGCASSVQIFQQNQLNECGRFFVPAKRPQPKFCSPECMYRAVGEARREEHREYMREHREKRARKKAVSTTLKAERATRSCTTLPPNVILSGRRSPDQRPRLSAFGEAVAFGRAVREREIAFSTRSARTRSSQDTRRLRRSIRTRAPRRRSFFMIA